MRSNYRIARFFGENLRKLRKEAGISQEELAFRSALHRTQVGVLERGSRVPRIDTLIKLASALEVEMKCPLTEGIEWDRRYQNGGAFVFLNEMDRRLEQLRVELRLPEEPEGE